VPSGYPILLDVSDKHAVIIGGGHVALRKVKMLAEAGIGRLTIISPKFADGFPQTAKKITGTFLAKHLADANIVIAATDSTAVNSEVVREAKTRGLLVNRADGDDAEPGNFTAPAALRLGEVTLAVWADSPALSAAIRDGLKSRWDQRWTSMASAMRELRPMIVASNLPAERRHDLLRWLASDEGMNILESQGIDGLRQWLEQEFPPHNQVPPQSDSR
jgi:precorrin-2 dehydrogenase/sirohydrochlorin ferrochelatase